MTRLLWFILPLTIFLAACAEETPLNKPWELDGDGKDEPNRNQSGTAFPFEVNNEPPALPKEITKNPSGPQFEIISPTAESFVSAASVEMAFTVSDPDGVLASSVKVSVVDGPWTEASFNAQAEQYRCVFRWERLVVGCIFY